MKKEIPLKQHCSDIFEFRPLPNFLLLRPIFCGTIPG